MTAVLLAMGFFSFGPSNLPMGHHSPGESTFVWAVVHRADAAVARAEFAKAASQFDVEWVGGARTPAAALNRGRAHFLAGNLPKAIVAFRDGLTLAPYDVRLQRGLLACRAAVAYPTEPEPSLRVRPDPPAALRNRVSPTDLFVAACASSLLAAVGLIRRFTSRGGWSDGLTAVGVVGVVLVAVAVWRIAPDNGPPVVVIASDTPLRAGNGAAYPTKLDVLPRGAEVRELGRRGGWVQVELPGGAAGWVSERLVLKTQED